MVSNARFVPTASGSQFADGDWIEYCPPHGCGAHPEFRALEVSAHSTTHHRSLAAVFASCLGVGLIFGFQPPLIALTLSRLGYSSFAIGAVTAASLIAVILCGPWYPRVIVRLGL